MLSETDPIENLRDFSMNLNNFIKVANASEDEEYWATTNTWNI